MHHKILAWKVRFKEASSAAVPTEPGTKSDLKIFGIYPDLSNHWADRYNQNIYEHLESLLMMIMMLLC